MADGTRFGTREEERALWLEFLEKTRGRDPDPGSLAAIAAAREALGATADVSRALGFAIDLGCGSGNETLAMLRAGFRVLAVDALPEAVAMTAERAAAEGFSERCATAVADLAGLDLPAGAALIHARFALPFVPESEFPRLWASIRAALAPGGCFAGQLFGPNDQFAREVPEGSMTFHDAAAVARLIEGLDILRHEEVAKPGYTALGRPKYWHVHHLLLRAPRVLRAAPGGSLK
jgi:SAM-dependent methyltransferase